MNAENPVNGVELRVSGVDDHRRLVLALHGGGGEGLTRLRRGGGRARVVVVLGLLGGLVPDDAVDGRHAGDVVGVANAVTQEPVSDLPREHRRVGLLVVGDGVHNAGRGHLGLGAADNARLDGPCLVVPEEQWVDIPSDLNL